MRCGALQKSAFYSLASSRGTRVTRATPRPQIILRKLDPKTRLPPRGDAHVSLWRPKPLALTAHRLGLGAMAAGGHLLVTTGATGSVKLTPEAALRVAAADAGVRLPHSASAAAEALTALLLGGDIAAALQHSASSETSSALSVGGLLQHYGSMQLQGSLPGSLRGASSSGQLQQAGLLAIDEEQAPAVAAAAAAAGHLLATGRLPSGGAAAWGVPRQPRQSSGALELGTPPARSPAPLVGFGSSGPAGCQQCNGGQQQSQAGAPDSDQSRPSSRQASRQASSSGPAPASSSAEAGAPPARADASGSESTSRAPSCGSCGGGGGGAGAAGDTGDAGAPPPRKRSFGRQPSGSWPQQQQLGLDSPWILKYEDLRLGRVLGEGSYGHVRIGSWRETEVAVKVGAAGVALRVAGGLALVAIEQLHATGGR